MAWSTEKDQGDLIPACRPRHVAKAAKEEIENVYSQRTVHLRGSVLGPS
jgi:hypothetical protein